jgi:hypothetical protein
MIDENRRQVLKQLGAATTLTAVAGCLDSGDSSGTSTDNGTSTPTPGQETDGQPDGDQAPDGEEGDEGQGETETSGNEFDGYGTEMFNWIPDSRYQEGETAFLAYSRPADIHQAVGDQQAQSYEEQGFWVPPYTDLGMDEIPENLSTRVVDIAVTDRDLTTQLEENLDSIHEEYGFTIYRGQIENEEGTFDVVVAHDGEKLVNHKGPDLPENYFQERTLPVLARIDDGGTPLIEGHPLDNAFQNTDFEHGLRGSLTRGPITEDGDASAPPYLVRGFNFGENQYEVARYAAGQDAVEELEPETYPIEDYPGLLGSP